MPQAVAGDIGLTPAGTMDLTFPDGTTEPIPVAWASVHLGAETKEGFIVLSQQTIVVEERTAAASLRPRPSSAVVGDHLRAAQPDPPDPRRIRRVRKQ